MKKNILIVLLLIIVLFLGYWFLIKNYPKDRTTGMLDNNTVQSKTPELTETFNGKFVSFKYPKSFSVKEDSNGYIQVLTNDKQYDGSLKKIFDFGLYSTESTIDFNNLSLDKWYQGYVLDTDRGAPNPDDNLSHEFKIADKYDAFYTIFVSQKGSFKFQPYEYFSPIDIYIKPNNHIFSLGTQRIEVNDNTKSNYSLDDIQKFQSYEKTFWAILDTMEFKN